jgi:hypothetical protein
VRASEALQAARATIEDPQHWCAGMFMAGRARCALGAYNEVRTGIANKSVASNDWGRWLLDEAAYVVNGLWSPVSVNDELGHAAVLEMFDIATSMALSDEAGL